MSKYKKIAGNRDGPRSRYKKPYSHYADQYSASYWSIVKYARAGAPLDDPVAMREWFAMRTHVPNFEANKQPGRVVKRRTDVRSALQESKPNDSKEKDVGVEQSMEALKKEAVRVKIQRERILRDKALGVLVPKDQVIADGVRIATALATELEALEQSAPGMIVGKNEREISAKLRSEFARVRSVLSSLIEGN